MKNGRVYPAESDPRQAKSFESLAKHLAFHDVHRAMARMVMQILAIESSEELAREFGPWVRASDGSWMRDRRKAKRRKR